MSNNIIREITPLTQNDCFTLFSRNKTEFDFPLHYHEEFELNLILNAGGAKRIVGDHIDIIEDLELVLVGPNLCHAWFNHNCKDKNITEITIQFHKDLFDDSLLRKNQLSFIRNMFEQCRKGILFSQETIERVKSRIIHLDKKQGFDSVLELISILHDLSTSRNMRTLSDVTFSNDQFNYNSRRIEKVFEYINNNYSKQLTLADVSKIANMPETSFSRFLKKRTGNTFIDSINEIRIGHASRMLIDTTNTIAEIAYNCGFNNISNFNRTFKKKKGLTPKEFREDFTGTRIFI
ncbi:MAG: helix-turn-helix transcriptional regulator [Oligoflexus sp.]|nr:helix-turn-helix transcriptional regulator [Pseudopedobacter sp.]